MNYKSIYETNHELNKTLYYDKEATKYGRTRAVPQAIDSIDLNPGDKVKFYGDRRWWLVRCANNKTTILTRTANFNKGNLYTIISWEDGHRGPHDSWNYAVETDLQCQETLDAFSTGVIALSKRRSIYLDLEKIK